MTVGDLFRQRAADRGIPATVGDFRRQRGQPSPDPTNPPVEGQSTTPFGPLPSGVEPASGYNPGLYGTAGMPDLSSLFSSAFGGPVPVGAGGGATGAVDTSTTQPTDTPPATGGVNWTAVILIVLGAAGVYFAYKQLHKKAA